MSNTHSAHRKSDESSDDARDAAEDPALTPDHLHQLYVEQDLTLREIAAQCDVSPATVQRRLRATDWYRPRLDVILDELDPDADDLRSDGGTVAAPPTADDPPSRSGLWDAVRALAETVEAQNDRIADLEATVEAKDERIDDQQDRIADLEDTVQTQRETIADLENWTDRKEETIRTVVADLNARDEPAEEGDPDPAGPDPASSPLDFFCNCQQYHVERHLSANRARAVQIVRRHEEFGRRKQSVSTYAGTAESDGSVVFTKRDVEEGLLAIQGRKPHRQTIQRVWDYLREMAGDDAEPYQFRDRKNDTTREGIRFAAETLDRFEEGRYEGLGLLADAGRVDPSSPGGVTPVVIPSGV